MPRGVTSPIGTETTNANGYVQVKTEKGWIGKHTLILQERLGRELRVGERAIFKDNDRTNLDPDNIELATNSSQRSIRARIARLKAEIEDRQMMINDLRAQLESSDE